MLKLANKEKGLYSNLFTRADPEGTNKVEGRAAVEFFKKSGLPVDVLKEIWNIASPNGESFLDRERFYIAVRLISYAQQGKPVSLDSISTNLEAELPVFTGSVERSEGDGFEVSAEEKAKYETIFGNTAGAKASLSGLEARALFERTGVDIADLSRIWTLADPQDTGLLTKSQFIVAMHLIFKVKQRIRVPEVLPSSLASILSTHAQAQKQQELYREFSSMPSPGVAQPPPKPAPDSAQPRNTDTFDAFQGAAAVPPLSFPKPPQPEKRAVEDRPVAPMPVIKPQARAGLLDGSPKDVLKPQTQSVNLMGDDDPFAGIPRPEVKPVEVRREPLVEGRRDAPVEVRRDPQVEPRRENTFNSAKIEDPVRDGSSQGPKGYYPQPKEDRRLVDDSAILSLQKSLKAMELQLEEVTEELRSTKKEVRLTREDAGQQLEDFSKEMRKQRDTTDQQMADLSKELRTERRATSETVETMKVAGKSLGECMSAFTTLRVQCEDALKQQQILSTQMQTSLQQSSAQQSKFLAHITEIMERHRSEIASLARRPDPEPTRTSFDSFPTTPARPQPESSIRTIEKQPGEVRAETTPKPEVKPIPPASVAKPVEKPTFEPEFSMSFSSAKPTVPMEEVKETKPTKEEVKEVPRKLGLEPPPVRSEDPKLPVFKPTLEIKGRIDDFDFDVQPRIVPSVQSKPEAVVKESTPKPSEKQPANIEGFDFPSMEMTPSYGVARSSPQVDEFRFEQAAKPADQPKFPAFDPPAPKAKVDTTPVTKPKVDIAPAKTDFSSYDFGFPIAMNKPDPPKTLNQYEQSSKPANLYEPEKSQMEIQRKGNEGKQEGDRKKSSNSSLDFDVEDDQPQANQLPIGKLAEGRIEEKGKGREKDEFNFHAPEKSEFDFSKAPQDSKGFEFGDFKAFEGAFKPDFNADFQNGVFKFDTGAVQQQSKKIAFEF